MAQWLSLMSDGHVFKFEHHQTTFSESSLLLIYCTTFCRFYSVLLATISQNVLEICSKLMCTRFYSQTLLTKKIQLFTVYLCKILNC